MEIVRKHLDDICFPTKVEFVTYGVSQTARKLAMKYLLFIFCFWLMQR